MSIQYKLSKAAIVAACILSAAGALVFNAFPLFLGNIATQYQFGDEELGLLGAAYLGAFALAALFAPLWMPRVAWKPAALFGYVFILVGSYLLSNAPADQVHMIMATIGLGSGIIFTISLGVLAAAKNPDTAYGWKLVTEMVAAGSLMFIMTSLIINEFGYQGFVVGIVVLYGLSALSIFALPKNFMATSIEAKVSGKKSKFNTSAALASIALFFQAGTFSGLWGFMERIGEIHGVDKQLIGTVLAASIAAGILGALCCVALGQKLGHRKPIAAGLVITLATLALLEWNTGTITFIVAACLINALLQFLVATLMALVTDKDLTGKYTVMMAFTLAMGGAIGPGVLGTIIEEFGFSMGYLWAAFFTLATMMLVLMATKEENKATDVNLQSVNG